MTEETENLVLELLRRVRASQDKTELDISELRSRISAIEKVQGQALVMLGTVNERMDRFDERLGRIERRLELVDA
jgi:hypothetical protein